jgi:hypothetical protein
LDAREAAIAAYDGVVSHFAASPLEAAAGGREGDGWKPDAPGRLGRGEDEVAACNEVISRLQGSASPELAAEAVGVEPDGLELWVAMIDDRPLTTALY